MSLTNYVSYLDPQTSNPRIGHYDLTTQTIQPLGFTSGTPINTLYQVIEASPSHISPSDSPIPTSSTKILPPLTGRDILCVGKNYSEHAREFNKSGFDSSDKVDQPSHPVIFTKRFTSIIADGEEIYAHPEFTRTADYEGEIGVIVGREGYRVSEEEAMEYVWGYTIVNDLTARERQRDHKQFYIGKSPDTFCPMGPIAVPAEKLDKVLRVQTHVNGELRQNATTEDLIFSIPYLIKTLSEGQTLMPGDVLATGTPAGVGIGRTPPIYLQPGDTISISVTGLHILTNRIASTNTPKPPVHSSTTLPLINASKLPNPSQTLTTINNKLTYYRTLGSPDAAPLIFVHGLGASSEYFIPLISAAKLDSAYTCHLYDLEGQGLSPTHPLSKLSIDSLTADLLAIFEYANITSGATIIAHGLGCLIALTLASTHPSKVSKLLLLNPQHIPLPQDARTELHARAQKVRTHGIAPLASTIAAASTSDRTQSHFPLSLAAVRLSLLSQDPEGYAKLCTAHADFTTSIDFKRVKAKVQVVTGDEEGPDVEEEWGGLGLEGYEWTAEIDGTGEWVVYEDLVYTGNVVKRSLGIE